MIRLLYPAYCVTCRLPLLLSETHLCHVCRARIQPVAQPACVKCGRQLSPYGHDRSTCGRCRSERRYHNRGYTLVTYEEPTKSIFHQIKYQGKPWLLNVFSGELERFLNTARVQDYDWIIPIPLDPKRERERGFNQALLIAHMLRSPKNKRVPVAQLLMKRKRTFSQSQLNRNQRLQNLINAFEVKNRRAICGKGILLVDDIFTTGSTVNECARVLKQHGARRVDFLAIARSQTK